MNQKGKVLIVLELHELELVLNTLAELPYKVSAGVMTNILAQAREAFKQTDGTEAESES